jgi:hypothetical protein
MVVLCLLRRNIVTLKNKIEKKLPSITKPVVIFDLDGTLFDVTYRTMRIFEEFNEQQKIKKQFKPLAEKASTVIYDHYKYSLAETLTSFGFDRSDKETSDYLKEAERFWFDRFFTDEYVVFDRPYARAKECVDFFKNNHCHIVYLSGRDVPNMIKGTMKSLEDGGFPVHSHEVSIHLKPTYGEDDLIFKKTALQQIDQVGNVVATFDNEPANVRMFAEHYESAEHIHFHTHFARHLDLKGKNLSTIYNFTDFFEKRGSH